VQRALILMFVSASRAVDLDHMEREVFDNVARITFVARKVNNSNFALQAPKSDPSMNRTITKWIPLAATEPWPARWPDYKTLYSQIRKFGITPHSLRQSAVQFLEQMGESTATIALLTGHSPVEKTPGISAYVARRPNDPAAMECLRLSTLLWEALDPTQWRVPSAHGSTPSRKPISL
jgi:integrase